MGRRPRPSLGETVRMRGERGRRRLAPVVLLGEVIAMVLPGAL